MKYLPEYREYRQKIKELNWQIEHEKINNERIITYGAYYKYLLRENRWREGGGEGTAFKVWYMYQYVCPEDAERHSRNIKRRYFYTWLKEQEYACIICGVRYRCIESCDRKWVKLLNKGAITEGDYILCFKCRRKHYRMLGIEDQYFNPQLEVLHGDGTERGQEVEAW